MPAMQGRARFAWRNGPGHTGQLPAQRWLCAGPKAASGLALAHKPARPRKPKARRLSAPGTPPAPEKPKDLLEGFCPEPSQEELIAVNSKGLMLSVRLADIEWMEAADNCVKLHVGKNIHRLRDTLPTMAAKLPPGRFLRISRSTLVNIEQIKGVQRMLFDEYEVLLHNGTRLILTRAYCENLRQIGMPLPALIPPIISSRFALGRAASN